MDAYCLHQNFIISGPMEYMEGNQCQQGIFMGRDSAKKGNWSPCIVILLFIFFLLGEFCLDISC